MKLEWSANGLANRRMYTQLKLHKSRSDLEKGPVDDENKAEEEHGDPVVERAARIHHGHLLDPRLPSRDPKHAREGPVEPEERQRRDLGEVVDPQDSVCPGKRQ